MWYLNPGAHGGCIPLLKCLVAFLTFPDVVPDKQGRTDDAFLSLAVICGTQLGPKFLSFCVRLSPLPSLVLNESLLRPQMWYLENGGARTMHYFFAMTEKNIYFLNCALIFACSAILPCTLRCGT